MRSAVKVILAMLLTMLYAACEEAEEETADRNSEPEVASDTGEPAEELALDVTGTPLGADRVFRLSDQRGRLVVLNFFATWCPPCRNEIPDLIRINEEMADRLVLVGISVDQNPAEVLPGFIDEYGIDYPVIPWDAVEDYDAVYAYYPHDSIPTTYIIDSGGKLVEKLVGSRDYETFRSIFESYLE